MRKLALALFVLSLPLLADDLACPAGLSSALDVADPVSSDSSAYDLWEFAGTQGQQVTVSVSATSFDPLVMLLDPSFVPVAVNDDLAAGTDDASLTFTLTATGRWTVVVNSLNAGGLGDYFVSLTSPSCSQPSGPRRRSVRH